MGSHAHNDVAVAGTSRHLREWIFNPPQSQKAFGKNCIPRASQAWVSQFDLAQTMLTRAGAERAAPACCPELWKQNTPQAKAAAIRETWRIWFTNVEHHGTEPVRRYAEKVKAIVLADVPSLAMTPLLDPNQNPSLARNSAGRGESGDLSVPGTPPLDALDPAAAPAERKARPA